MYIVSVCLPLADELNLKLICSQFPLHAKVKWKRFVTNVLWFMAWKTKHVLSTAWPPRSHQMGFYLLSSFHGNHFLTPGTYIGWAAFLFSCQEEEKWRGRGAVTSGSFHKLHIWIQRGRMYVFKDCCVEIWSPDSQDAVPGWLRGPMTVLPSKDNS